MIKNRFLRILLFVPVSFITLMIAGELFPSSDFVMFGVFFSALIWFAFVLQRELMGSPSNGFLSLIKNIFIIAMLVVGFFSILVGLVTFFTEGNEEGSMALTSLIAPALTLCLALYLSDEETTAIVKLSYLSVFAVTVVSVLLSMLLTTVSIVATIAAIVFAVGSVLVTVLAFKKWGWIEFESVSFTRSSYSRSTYSGSSSSTTRSSSSSSSTSRSSSSSSYYSNPRDAMNAVARKCGGKCALTASTFYYNVTCTVSGGAAHFKINGTVTSDYGATESDAKQAVDDLHRQIRNIQGDIKYHYEKEGNAMVENGVDCSSIATLRISVGDISVT